jgi:hypothetical protein
VCFVLNLSALGVYLIYGIRRNKIFIIIYTLLSGAIFYSMPIGKKKATRVWWFRSNPAIKSGSFGFKPVLKLVVIVLALAALVFGLVNKDWN